LSASAQEPGLRPATLRSNALTILAPLPDKMPGAERDSAALVALGGKLYFEKRLSQNESQSCSTCHPLNDGGAGVDNQPTSAGAFGKRGTRNSPTTLNAGFQFAQFWDGRAANLQQQAGGPPLNPVEMAMPDQDSIVARLKKDPDYPRQFAEVFPGKDNPLTFVNVTFAIAAFERTLITHDRLDDFLKGSDDALTPAELKGLNTFLTIGCTTCHNGPLIGGNSFRKCGVFRPYTNQTDLGRGAIIKDEDFDQTFLFKVPSLRNVAATAPYFHDGGTAALPDAVRTMAAMQLNKDLTTEQVQDLVAFLQCLTGKGIKTRSGEVNRGASTAANQQAESAQNAGLH
jgi:cytochrome c peroxidase